MAIQTTRRQTLIGGGTLLAALTTGVIPAAVAGVSTDSITVRVDEDLKSLDPANRTGPIDVNVINAVQQGLISFKPGSTEWELDAAEEITQVSDTEIAFKLRKGLAFTGGYGDVTAEDVKFSFERFIKPGANGKKVTYADDWLALDHVEVTGPLEGRIILKNAAPALWVITLADGSGRIISKKAFQELGEEKIATTLIGSGPYILKEWKPRDHFTLEINPDYGGPIKPHFKTIVGRPIAEQKTADIAFKAGEIDFTLIAPESVKQFKEVPGTSTIELPAIDYVWIGPNIEKKPFDDLRVRQALRLAIDVDAILAGAYGGNYPRANALLAPSLLGYWKGAPAYKRDVEAAKKLLAEAGLPDGFNTRLTVLASPEEQAIAAIVQANLAEVGIALEIEALDEAAYWALGENDASSKLELSLIKYRGKFDPSFQTQWFTSDQVGTWNWQRWKSKEFDELHVLGAKTVDRAEREKIYVKAQQLQDESAAFIWITHNLYTFAAKDWLKPGVLPNGNNWLYPAFQKV